MKKFRTIFFKILGAKTSLILLIVFCGASFLFGQYLNDMNLFASSGAIISVFGLLYTIKFTTLKNYLTAKLKLTHVVGLQVLR
ncbi:hypothetical protein EWN61_05450 [Salmonella enterica]|nr:hypothetical protein [Salmonella enterica]